MDNLEEKLEKILDKKFKSFENVFDRKIDKRFEKMEKSFDGKFEKIDQRFEKIDQRFDKMEKSFDGKIEDLALSVQKEFSKIHEKLDEHTGQNSELNNKVDSLDTKINTTKLELLDKLGSKEKLEDHELRIQNIEEKVFQA